jgi:hypothetical protein
MQEMDTVLQQLHEHLAAKETEWQSALRDRDAALADLRERLDAAGSQPSELELAASPPPAEADAETAELRERLATKEREWEKALEDKEGEWDAVLLEKQELRGLARILEEQRDSADARVTELERLLADGARAAASDAVAENVDDENDSEAVARLRAKTQELEAALAHERQKVIALGEKKSSRRVALKEEVQQLRLRRGLLEEELDKERKMLAELKYSCSLSPSL